MTARVSRFDIFCNRYSFDPFVVDIYYFMKHTINSTGKSDKNDIDKGRRNRHLMDEAFDKFN